MKYNLRYRTWYGKLDKMVAKIAKSAAHKNFSIQGLEIITVQSKGGEQIEKIIHESLSLVITFARDDGYDLFHRPYAHGPSLISIGNKSISTPAMPSINQAALTIDGNRFVRTVTTGHFIPDVVTGCKSEKIYRFEKVLGMFLGDLQLVLKLIENS